MGALLWTSVVAGIAALASAVAVPLLTPMSFLPWPVALGASGTLMGSIGAVFLVLRQPQPTHGGPLAAEGSYREVLEAKHELQEKLENANDRNRQLEAAVEEAKDTIANLREAREEDQETIEQLGTELEELQTRLKDTEKVIEALPRDLIDYYLHGEDRDEKIAAQARERTNELEAEWRAKDDSLSLRFVQPLLDTCEQIAEDAADDPPVHHYTAPEVVEMLASIAEEWENDNWSIKAMRWLRLNYGPG